MADAWDAFPDAPAAGAAPAQAAASGWDQFPDAGQPQDYASQPLPPAPPGAVIHDVNRSYLASDPSQEVIPPAPPGVIIHDFDRSYVSDRPDVAAARPADASNEVIDTIMQGLNARGTTAGRLTDIGKSAASGVISGVTNTIGLPGTLADLGQQGLDYVARKAEKMVTGTEPKPITEMPGYQANPLSGQKVTQGLESVVGDLYKPQTVPGQFAHTIGEFAPQAMVGPGSLAGRIVGDAVIPAVTSEAAGQATKGTPYEPYARFAGGAFGNAATASTRAYANADNAVAAQAARGVDPAQYDAAQQLADTAARIGVPLSGPEAIQEATRGGTKLADVQRVVESSLGGGPVTAQFYANRPQQVTAATTNVLDAISPPSAAPSTLGPRAAEAAQGSLDEVRRNINDATRPAYRAAENHTLAGADFAPIERDPAFQASLARLRNDPVLGPTYQNQPDNSVAVINAVTMEMRDRGVALGNAANPGFSSQTAAIYGTGAAEARDIARDPTRGGIQAYDDALTMQAQARQQNLAPLEQGPLGRIANTNTTQGAYNEILPAQPLAGGGNEIVDAIMRMDTRDQGLPASLVRQSMADKFDQAGRRIATGENQSIGGRYVNSVAGTPEQTTLVQQVLDAIAPGARPQNDDLVSVLRATQQRKPMGSPTEPNRMINEQVERTSFPVAAAMSPATAGTSMISELRNRARLGIRNRAHNDLADLFTAPDSVQRIRELGLRDADRPYINGIVRQLLQTGASN